MTEICGRPQSKPFASYDRNMSSWKTFPDYSPQDKRSFSSLLKKYGSLIFSAREIRSRSQDVSFVTSSRLQGQDTSAPFSETWPKAGTMQNGQCWALTTLGHRTDGKGCGYWPTPNAGDGQRGKRIPDGKRGLLLTDCVHSGQPMWPTPRSGKTTSENEETWMKRYNEGKVATPPLSLAVKVYPTPRCCSGLRSSGANRSEFYQAFWPTPKGTPSGPDYARMNREKSGGDDLATAVAKFPAPTSSMVTEQDFVQAKFHSSKRPPYSESVLYPTPKSRDWKGKSQRGTHSPGDALCNTLDVTGGQLNPGWVCWLMAWPKGWTSLDPLPGHNYESWLLMIRAGKWWSVDPADIGEIPRVATGIKNRPQRLKAIGNGQVPLCFAVAWTILRGDRPAYIFHQKEQIKTVKN